MRPVSISIASSLSLIIADFASRRSSEVNAVGVRQLPAAQALPITALLKPDSLREKALINKRPMLTKRRSDPQFASQYGALSRLEPTVRMRIIFDRIMIEKKSRILIAEDFEENRTALTLILKYAGFDVIEVENGRQAVDAVHQEEPDLVLMDVTLPIVDGLQATREIRSDEKFERLPIIILSAHDSDEIRQQAAEAGGSEYLSKPFEIAELKKLIEGCLTVN